MILHQFNFMNNYYGNPSFPGNPLYSSIPTPNQQTAQTASTELSLEQSYIENILRLNKGKVVTVHMTFPDSNEYRDREFTILKDRRPLPYLVKEV